MMSGTDTFGYACILKGEADLKPSQVISWLYTEYYKCVLNKMPWCSFTKAKPNSVTTQGSHQRSLLHWSNWFLTHLQLFSFYLLLFFWPFFPVFLSLRHPVSPRCLRVAGDTGAVGGKPSYLQQQLLWPLWVSIDHHIHNAHGGPFSYLLWELQPVI